MATVSSNISALYFKWKSLFFQRWNSLFYIYNINAWLRFLFDGKVFFLKANIATAVVGCNCCCTMIFFLYFIIFNLHAFTDQSKRVVKKIWIYNLLQKSMMASIRNSFTLREQKESSIPRTRLNFQSVQNLSLERG